MDICIQELTEWPERLAAQAKELYERSFPVAELRDFARMLRIDEEQDDPGRPRVLVTLNGDDLLGLSIFKHLTQASLGYLWYLCVDEAARESGIGRRLYKRSLEALIDGARSDGFGLKGVIFEVERLDSDPHSVYGDPIRRVRFYERLGARLILGYDYWQPPIPPHGPVPLQLMFHPLEIEESECTEAGLARIVADFLRYGQGMDDADVNPASLRLALLTDIKGGVK